MDSPIFEQFIFISYILDFNKFFPVLNISCESIPMYLTTNTRVKKWTKINWKCGRTDSRTERFTSTRMRIILRRTDNWLRDK